MPNLFAAATRASLPLARLQDLAALRTVPGVEVLVEAERCWVRWDGADDRPWRVLLPLHGVRFLKEREGLWFRVGSRLPEAGVPEEGYRPLHDVLFPEAVVPLPPPAGPFRTDTDLRLVPADEPRRTTALMAPLTAVQRWLDGVSTARFGDLRASFRDRHVLVLGKRLPDLLEGTRYWGEKVLLPLGWRAEPDLPESTLREALGIVPEELLILGEEGAEVVPLEAFGPLTRAGIRLAAAEVGP